MPADMVLSRLINTLALSDPAWDLSPGTPEYKMLEAFSVEIDRVLNNNTLHDYHFDIDTKIAVELDRFCGLFGIERLKGTRATGTVLLSRGTPAVTDIDIPSGVQVVKPATVSSVPIYFQTTAAGTIATGQTSVEVPIEAQVVGASGNVISDAITLLGVGAAATVTVVTNTNPTAGGTDVEADLHLRQRWKDTVFRNLAGTEDQYLSTALVWETVSKAVVIGPVERHREQLEIIAAAATSQISDARFVYPTGAEFFGYDIGTADEEFGVVGADYTFANSIPPVFTVLDSVQFPNATVVDVEFDYTPTASRNDPDNNIMHKVDIMISGQRATSVTEQTIYRNTAGYTFNNTGGSPMLRTQWQRTSGANPTNGNFFLALTKTPLITIPSSITVGPTTWTLGTHYWLVRDITTARGSARARDGIEWLSTGTPPSNNDAITATYTYNSTIDDLDQEIQALRPVGTDTLVHEGKRKYLRFHLAVMFGQSYAPSVEATAISAALEFWLSAKSFRDNVQISDMVAAIMAVPSVDAVRLTTAAENGANYGIKEIAEDGTTVLNTYTTDIYLKSDELPELESAIISVRGLNTY